MTKIHYFSPEKWAKSVAIQVQECLDRILKNKGACSILLTGGRSAEMVYKEWSRLPNFLDTDGASFYFGDERCVRTDSPLSNYSMTARTLFSGEKRSLVSIFRIEGESNDPTEAAKKYEKILPITIDILLLTVGDDGHIASIFPNSELLFDKVNRVATTVMPGDFLSRITITPLVIAQAKNIFVLAPGKEKLKILTELLNNRVSSIEIPAFLALHGTWFINKKINTFNKVD